MNCCNKPMRTHYGDGLPRPEPWCSMCGRKGAPPMAAELGTLEDVVNVVNAGSGPVYPFVITGRDNGLIGFTDDPAPSITLASAQSVTINQRASKLVAEFCQYSWPETVDTDCITDVPVPGHYRFTDPDTGSPTQRWIDGVNTTRAPNGRDIELKLDTVKAPADNHVFIDTHFEPAPPPRVADYANFFHELNEALKKLMLSNRDLTGDKDE